MLVIVERVAVCEHVVELALPAMPALIGGESIGEGFVGGLLQIEIERGVDAKSGFVHLLGAESLFKFAAHFFLEPGRYRHLRLTDVKPKWRTASLISLLMRDHAVRLHLAEDKIAAAQSLLRINQRRVGGWSFGQTGKQSGLGEIDVLGVLAKVKLRCRFKTIHTAAEVDLVAVERKYLLLGEGALDLDGEIGLLQLAGCGAVGGEEQVARQLHGERGGALRAAV